jgi:hypothetical protein
LDLRYSESDERFRAELRAWLADAVPKHAAPPPAHDWDARVAYDCGWQRKLFDAGYAGINWPKDFGGRELSATEQLVYYEETARAGAPYVGVNFVGLLHGGPTIIAEGTPEQKAKHLPRILRGEELWCQGFSEPGAGSDLAALATRAIRVGAAEPSGSEAAEPSGSKGFYIVNGHKIWCSFAHVGEFCELLVRTDADAPKHRGISWLICPMNLPGIEIRPLPTLAGESEFSEVFFSDVRVPIANRVGAENDGWRVTNVTLRFERGTAFASEMIKLQRVLADLVVVAKRVTRHDVCAWDDAGLRREVGHLLAELDALWAMVKRSVSEASKTGVPGLEGSAIKLFYTELFQRVSELGVRILGRAGLSRDDVAGLPSSTILQRHLNSLSLTIAAGSSQIQRNIVGERILGLPKDR